MVKLKGIHGSFSRVNVLAAVERFGKIKSFLLFPSKLEVCTGDVPVTWICSLTHMIRITVIFAHVETSEEVKSHV